MNIKQGNLITLALAGEFDVIIHGCNCFHKMGAGIALEIKRAFPEAYECDIDSFKYGDIKKLGNYSAVFYDDLVVINAYTQYKYSSGALCANYNAIRKVFKKIAKDFNGKKIAIPKIGAGLAGGDWAIIKNIIEQEMTGQNITLVVLK